MIIKGKNTMISIQALRAFIFPFVLLFASIATAQSAPQAAPPPSAADFAKKDFRGFTISPNGQNLAFISGEGENAKVVLADLTNGNLQTINIDAELKPRGVAWAGDKYILIYVSMYFNADGTRKNSNYRYEIERTVSFSIENKRTKLLMPLEELQYNTGLPIEYLSQDNPTEIILSAYEKVVDASGNAVSGRSNLALYKTSLATGRGYRITGGNENTQNFIFDNDGKLRLRIDIHAVKRNVKLLKFEANKWEILLEFDDAIELPFSIEGFLDANNVLIIQDDKGKGTAKKLNIQNGDITNFFENETAAVSNVILDPYSKTPIRITYDSFEPNFKWISPEMGRVQELLEKAFPDKYVRIYDWDKAARRFIIAVDSADSPLQYFFFDTEGMSANAISLLPESFEEYEFAPKTIEKMTASDGLEITVLVTRPRNSSGKKLPAIVLPHGGPEASDDPGFDYESQFLASRGYVVIQPQFRGSTGFGSDFAQKGYGEWAGKMQSDVNETVKWANDKGWIDKDRVCIVGSSYGGYSALVGVAHTPDLYKCAASFGGVFDLAEMQERAEDRGGYKSSSLAYWKESIGFSNKDKEKIRAISPVFQAQNVKVPVLLMHGIEDTVVPIKQSRDMANALRRAGKAVQLIEFEREDHWLSRQETRERYLVELEKFLAPILKPEQ